MAPTKFTRQEERDWANSNKAVSNGKSIGQRILEGKALVKTQQAKKQKVDPFYNTTIDDDYVPEDSMADVRYKMDSDKFDIDVDEKVFHISLKRFCTEAGYSTVEGGAGPWPSVVRNEKGEKDLGATCPKISMISSETGKAATFFLAESTEGYLIFKPSKGTVMHKSQLRGWIIEVER